MVAGQDFVYAMRGDDRTPTRWVSAADQRKALDALAATLKPAELTIPKNILDLIPPRPPGYGMHRELFIRTTGEAFDPIAPARVAADVTIGFVLQPDRASRMVAQNAVDPALPGLGDAVDRLTQATFAGVTTTPYEAAVKRASSRVLVDRLMWLASVAPDSQVRAIASRKLQRLAARNGTATANELDTAHALLIAADIKRFLERPAETARMPTTTNAPPGAPIGGNVPQNWLATPTWCLWEDEQ
jgi:Met-zincin